MTIPELLDEIDRWPDNVRASRLNPISGECAYIDTADLKALAEGYRRASVFVLVEEGPEGRPVNIERRLQRDGAVNWIVSSGSFVLDKDGEWQYEPMPSSRTDEYLALTRFDSIEAAEEAYRMTR